MEFHLTPPVSSYCSCHPLLSCSVLAIRHDFLFVSSSQFWLRRSVAVPCSHVFPPSMHCSTCFAAPTATCFVPKPLPCFRTNLPSSSSVLSLPIFLLNTPPHNVKQVETWMRMSAVDPFHISALCPTYVGLSPPTNFIFCRSDTCEE